MKIIKPESLSINEDISIKESFIGNSKSKIIVVEDFFINPDFVREYALNCVYIDEKLTENLGNPNTDQTHWYTHRTSLNESHYREFFGWVKKEVYQDVNWQYDVYPTQFSFQSYDKIGPCVPHVDSTNYAGLVPLNTNDEISGNSSGTGFYRHRKTNLESVTSQTYKHWEMSKMEYNEFQKYHTQYHRYNTLIMYEAKLLHSAEAKWKSPENRLTFNFFTW